MRASYAAALLNQQDQSLQMSNQNSNPPPPSSSPSTNKEGSSSSHQNRVINPADPFNPYYIHPGENPASILVSSVLDGSNYISWLRAMKMALLTKNKLKFVDGSIKPPKKDSVDFDFWERCNTLVLSWILHSVSKDIAQSVIWLDTAFEVWSDLENRFCHGDSFRTADLQEEWYSLKQGAMSLSEYYTKFKTISDELNKFRPVLACSCDLRCKCGVLESVRKYFDNEHTTRLLKGLNEAYSNTRSQLMLLDPLSKASVVIGMLQKQERQFMQEGLLSGSN